MKFDKWGGRKQFNGYLYAVLTTVMALVLDADFTQYSTMLAVALLGTSAVVAWEDNRRGGSNRGSQAGSAVGEHAQLDVVRAENRGGPTPGVVRDGGHDHFGAQEGLAGGIIPPPPWEGDGHPGLGHDDLPPEGFRGPA